MYDALMVAAITAELNDVVLDGRVQRTLLLDPLTIGLEIYVGGRHQVLISAGSRDARLHLVGDDGGRLTGDAATVTPLALLLRKYVRGARLVRVYQDPPLERAVFLRFAKFVPVAGQEPAADDAGPDDEGEEPVDGELVETTLAIEMMGRHSNLILIDAEGRIMDSAKRVPARLSRVRQVLPKLPYTPPPPQGKADPLAATPATLTALLAADPDAQAQQVLVGAFRGLSPQIAREAAFRATGAVKTKAGEVLGREEALGRALDELFAPLRTGAWAPRLYLRDPEGGAGDAAGDAVPVAPEPVAFSPVPLLHLRALREERFTSPSLVAERFFGATAQVQAHGQRKEALAVTIRQERDRVASRERALEVEAARAEEAERWRRWGEAIYAWSWSLEPGQRELIADDLTVPLDPAQSPSENAQEYFERYRKARAAAEHLPALLAEARLTLAYLDQLLTMLRLAERFEGIEAIAREWDDWRAGRHHGGGDGAGGGRGQEIRKGAAKGRGRGGALARPQTLRARGGHQIFIGHSGPQNDAVTFDIAAQDDTWLHSRGLPGAHVIVKWAGGGQDEAVLQAAAELAAHYSGGRESGRVEVDYAARRDVRKIKGGGPGMVTYRNERTMRVAPRGEDELRRQGLIE